MDVLTEEFKSIIREKMKRKKKNKARMRTKRPKDQMAMNDDQEKGLAQTQPVNPKFRQAAKGNFDPVVLDKNVKVRLNS